MEAGTLSERLDDWAAGLDQMAEQADAHVEGLRADLGRAVDDARRIRKARTALRPPKTRSRKKQATWTCSAKTREAVMAVIRERGEVTAAEVVEAAGVGITSVQRAIKQLREEPEPRVRLAGRRGTAHLYKPMDREEVSAGA